MSNIDESIAEALRNAPAKAIEVPKLYPYKPPDVPLSRATVSVIPNPTTFPERVGSTAATSSDSTGGGDTTFIRVTVYGSVNGQPATFDAAGFTDWTPI